jgi:hypothetical protein
VRRFLAGLDLHGNDSEPDFLNERPKSFAECTRFLKPDESGGKVREWHWCHKFGNPEIGAVRWIVLFLGIRIVGKMEED